MNSIKKIFWISLAIKLIIAAVLPLTGDEAYYWVWSKHMQLSYYDHPPFVAWLYWLGGPFAEWFPGSVRWPGVILGHMTLTMWLLLLAPYLNFEQRRIWLWLALLSPLVGGSGIVVTPDLPLMFFYALSLWFFFIWAKNPERKVSLGFGIAMGLGFSSKYMMVLFGLSLFPVVVMDAKLRRDLISQLPWLILGCALGMLPVLLWNYLHDFQSFKFQATHGLGRKKWKPSWTIEYILAQIGLIFPLVLYWAIRAGRRLPRAFHFIAWTPVLFFLLTTARGYAEANWPIAAYPAIFALAASWYPVNSRSLISTALIWAGLMAFMLTVILTRPNWTRDYKFREFHQFDAITEVARDLDPLYTRSYQMAAKLSFDLKRPVYKLRGMNRKDFFDFLEESEPKSNVYYLAVEKSDSLPLNYKSAGHQEVEVIPVDNQYEIRKVVVQ